MNILFIDWKVNEKSGIRRNNFFRFLSMIAFLLENEWEKVQAQGPTIEIYITLMFQGLIHRMSDRDNDE